MARGSLDVATGATTAASEGTRPANWYDNQERLPEHVSTADGGPGPSSPEPTHAHNSNSIRRRSGSGNPRAQADLPSPEASPTSREQDHSLPASQPGGSQHVNMDGPPQPVPEQDHPPEGGNIVAASLRSLFSVGRQSGMRKSLDQTGTGAHGRSRLSNVAGNQTSHPSSSHPPSNHSAGTGHDSEHGQQTGALRAKPRRASFLGLFSSSKQVEPEDSALRQQHSLTDATNQNSGSEGPHSSFVRPGSSAMHADRDAPPSRAKSRRSSFLSMFAGSGLVREGGGQHEGPGTDHERGSKPERQPSKSRRSSFAALFGGPSQHKLDVDGQDGEGEGSRQLRAKSERVMNSKGRRSSFADFFGGHVGSTSKSMSAAGGRQMMPQASSKSRRASMVDLLSRSSKKGLALLAKMVNRDNGEDTEGQEVEEDEVLWFTSMNDFKPLTYMYHRGRYMLCFFACAKKTGEHYVLKQFEKELMMMSDVRGVRRALAFGQLLEHENLIKIMGTWETDEALCIVEEYASKGDIMQDSMSHPERYTEAFMALNVIKPLLTVLSYLHQQKIIHRSVYPENVMFGRDSKLRLGHFTTAIDMRMDAPTDRLGIMDYMAPEMLAIKDDAARAAAAAGMQALDGTVGAIPTRSSRPGGALVDPVVVPSAASQRSKRGIAAVLGEKNPEFYSQLGSDDLTSPVQRSAVSMVNPRRSSTMNPDRNPEFYAQMSRDMQSTQSPLHTQSLAPSDTEGGAGPSTFSGAVSQMSRSFTARVNPRRSSAINPNRNPDFDAYAQQLSDSGSLLPPELAEAAGHLASPHSKSSAGRLGQYSSEAGHPVPSAAPPFMQRLSDGAQAIELADSVGTGHVSASGPGPMAESIEIEAAAGRPGLGGTSSPPLHVGAASLPTSPARTSAQPPHSALKTSAAHAGSKPPSISQRIKLGISATFKRRASHSFDGTGKLEGVGEEDEEQPQRKVSESPLARFSDQGHAKPMKMLFQRKQSHLPPTDHHPGAMVSRSAQSVPVFSPAALLAAIKPPPESSSIMVPANSWEWQDTYDEKVDIWQVGCFIHEVMCGCTPFEAEDKMLAAALILWADITNFPETLSQECGKFIQACLTKDPKERPSAEELLKHPWITRHEAGEILQPQKLERAATNVSEAHSQKSQKENGGWVPSWAKKLFSWVPGMGAGHQVDATQGSKSEPARPPPAAQGNAVTGRQWDLVL